MYSVAVASATQIGYIWSLASATDLLNDIWPVVVCGQVVQVTSIMTSTVPSLKPFLLSLESGFLGPNSGSRTTTSAFESGGRTNQSSSYIKIGSQYSRNRAESKAKKSILVQKSVMVSVEGAGPSNRD